MKESLFDRFKQLFNEYKSSEQYEYRKKQYAFVGLAREIILETLKHSALQNEHLTGLIQMLKAECTENTFDKYLAINILDLQKKSEFKSEFKEIGNLGYTGTGLNSVNNLTEEQLSHVKTFLQNAFNVTTAEEAYQICQQFEQLNIPQVKSGIYSPWLYYINPSLFPISNNTHDNFKKWLNLSADYPNYIHDFKKLSSLVDETDLGPLDDFAHRFTTDEYYWDVDGFIKKLHSRFPKIWRCATSGQWENFLTKSVLSINWLDNTIDYKKIKKFKEGKIPLSRWVEKMKEGDLIFLLDKYNYFGIAVVKSQYKYQENDKVFSDKTWPCIDIEFIHYLDNPVNHDLNITHTNPATFFELQGLSFDEKSTLLYIRKSFPEAIEKLNGYLKSLNPVIKTDMTNSQTINFPINSILYGPPGTGKTFHSISHAVAIIDNEKVEDVLTRCETDREGVKKRYEELVKSGQIVFCTFHQSMGYEDFIEGIKPVLDEEENNGNPHLTYNVKDGIFKNLCLEAAFSYVQKQATAETKRVLDFSEQYDQFVRSTGEQLDQGEIPEVFTISNQKVIIDNISQKNNLTVRHENGARTYIVSKQRLSQLAQAFPNLNTITNIYDQFGSVIGGSNASAYWAVLNAIRMKYGKMVFDEKSPSLEKEYTTDEKMSAVETLKNENYKIDNSKRFVLIIDEINRGNVAQIFGELITLIESDKRLGRKEALQATLPYSVKKLGVPRNLYIVGTMNTADRSVEALDTALRRRFSFIHMKPEELKLPLDCDGINLQKLLETLNRRLRILKDEDHTIGHAWLMGVQNLEDIKAVFANKILPLLQEYFYNDYEKLGLVLGDAFFVTPHERVGGNEFASFTGSNGLAGQYNSMYIYKLKNPSDLTKEDFLTMNTVITENEV